MNVHGFFNSIRINGICRNAAPVIIFLLLACKAISQDLPNTLRSKILRIENDSTLIDSLSIIPGSVKISPVHGGNFHPEDFEIDNAKAIIIRRSAAKNNTGNEFKIEYRVFPVNFAKPYFHKDSSLNLNYRLLPGKDNDLKSRDNLQGAEEDQLTKNGSISRGIVLGNQRDIGTLSNLNLQLAGKLNEDVSVVAAISDNNMPIQPDGNTQKLQEFDKVNIHLFTKKSGIEIGDISLPKPEGFFMKINKQTLGMHAYSGFNYGENKKFSLKSGLSSGIAKGKYNRQQIKGIEGNQGPYRLLGNNAEPYIIILSGSERIYINGKLLARGEMLDYVIDYNAAQIVFTANQPITKDSRIIAEFEYAQQYYPRMQILQTNVLQLKNASFWFNVYLDRDNKNDPLSDNYDDRTRLFLSGLGDSIQNAYAPNIRNTGFSLDRILYLLKDSLVEGVLYDSVYEYSTNPSLAINQLGFSYVGENRGNYKLSPGNANGRVFEWVAPINGVRQGDYEPVSFFVTPKKTLMLNAGGRFLLNPYGKANIEMAISNYDANTWSEMHNKDDAGFGLKFDFEQGLLNADTTNIQLNVFAGTRIVGKNFRPIENYQETEFERNWNLPAELDNWKEQTLYGGVIFRKKHTGMAVAKYTQMHRDQQYNGQKAEISVNMASKGFRITSEASWLKTKNLLFQSEYFKQRHEFTKQTKYLVAGLSGESENNQWKNHDSTGLSSNSFRFYEYALFVKEPDSSTNKYFARYSVRRDYLPVNGSYNESALAKTAQAGLQFRRNRNFISKTVLTFREVSFTDSVSQPRTNEEYLSGRQELTLRLFKGLITGSVFYETGSGLEIKKQYQFIEVSKGQGQFFWIDYNQNNLKELDEFEPARFPDEADHIQIFLPTTDYFRLYTTQLNASFSIQPGRKWLKEKGLKGIISGFSNQIAGQVMQKANHPDFVPDVKDNDDLISRLMMVRNNLAFKSKNRKIQLDYLVDFNQSKNILFNGYENRFQQNHMLKNRISIHKIITLYGSLLSGMQEFDSENFNWKNYQIKKQSGELQFEIRPSGSFLTSIAYRSVSKVNVSGIEKSGLNEIKISGNREIKTKASLEARLSYVMAHFNMENVSPLEYEMLEGLKKGRNLIWGLDYNHQLSKVLFLTVSYNGRITGDYKAIHNGSVQLRANF